MLPNGIIQYGANRFFQLSPTVLKMLADVGRSPEVWDLDAPRKLQRTPRKVEGKRMVGNLNPEDHAEPIARALQAVHYPDLVDELETVAPQYINEAKGFIAMLNKALSLLGEMLPARHIDETTGQAHPDAGPREPALEPAADQSATDSALELKE